MALYPFVALYFFTFITPVLFVHFVFINLTVGLVRRCEPRVTLAFLRVARASVLVQLSHMFANVCIVALLLALAKLCPTMQRRFSLVHVWPLVETSLALEFPPDIGHPECRLWIRGEWPQCAKEVGLPRMSVTSSAAPGLKRSGGTTSTRSRSSGRAAMPTDGSCAGSSSTEPATKASRRPLRVSHGVDCEKQLGLLVPTDS